MSRSSIPFVTLSVLASLSSLGCAAASDEDAFTNELTDGGAPVSSETGGASGTGGFVGTGGAPISGGSGGMVGSGGAIASGGAIGSGGGLGTGGVIGSGGAIGSGGGLATGGLQGTGGEDPGPVDSRPPCLDNPTQVISMGDSYMNWGTHTFPADLNAVASMTFRPTYAVGGFSMGSGGIGLIPPLFDVAFAADPDIIAVVLDGGGNDVLIPALGRPDCKNMLTAATDPGCQQIVTDALTAADNLTKHIADIAPTVHDVVYYFYPHVPEPTALGGTHPNVMLDYALPRVREFCEGVSAKTGGKLNCWFVDTIPLFEGHPEYFAPADIHENSTGSRVIAQAVWDTMKAHCIAQPESSGCCKP